MNKDVSQAIIVTFFLKLDYYGTSEHYWVVEKKKKNLS